MDIESVAMDEAIKSDDEEFEGVIVIEDIMAAKFKTFIWEA